MLWKRPASFQCCVLHFVQWDGEIQMPKEVMPAAVVMVCTGSIAMGLGYVVIASPL